jgi:hypothetical protein
LSSRRLNVMIQRHRSMEVYMRPIKGLVFLASCLLLAAPGLAAASDQGVPLTSVARAANLQYEWLAAQRAVQLSGPGLVLVIRPGNVVYDVNQRVELADTAPQYVNNELIVSPALAKHIEQIASVAWNAYSRQQAELSHQFMATHSAVVPVTHGSIVLHVQPLKGQEALLVTGEAPPSVPVRITLLATLSSDIPNVLLSRNDIVSNTDGTFQAIVPIAPDYLKQSFVHVLATSLPGVDSASAQILVDAPNAGVVVPAEAFPGGIW